MNFDLNSEQIQIQDSFARFFADGAKSHSRALKNSSKNIRELSHAAAEMGILAMLFSEENGGLYSSPTETMIAMEEVGKSLCNIPLAETAYACRILDKADDFAGKDELIASIISGEKTISIAFDEFNNRSNGAIVKTNENNGVINGVKTNANFENDYFLVNAQMTGGNIGIFLIANDAKGLNINKFITHDTSAKCDLYFENVGAVKICNDSNVVEYAKDFATIALCYEAIGMMRMITNLTSEYLKTRNQFGVPLSSFQVLQHRAVDMLIETEQALSIAIYASLLLDNDDIEARKIAVSNAKLRVNNAAKFVSQQAVQLHGGIGMTDEYIGAHYFKRLTLFCNMMGDNYFHLNRLNLEKDILEI